MAAAKRELHVWTTCRVFVLVLMVINCSVGEMVALKSFDCLHKNDLCVEILHVFFVSFFLLLFYAVCIAILAVPVNFF